MRTLTIYTDGSWWEKRQGSASVFFLSGHWFYLTKYEHGGTNNRAELMGVIDALEFLKKHREIYFDKVQIYSDSQYVVKGIMEYMPRWRLSNFKNGTLKNMDLWKWLGSLFDPKVHELIWVKAHEGTPGNELANALAAITQEKCVEQRRLKKYTGEYLSWSSGSYNLHI